MKIIQGVITNKYKGIGSLDKSKAIRLYSSNIFMTKIKTKGIVINKKG